MSEIQAVASEFHIRYEGDAIRDGQIDARALADSLLALTDTIERSNKVINGKDTKVSVKVDANMQPGSFIVSIATFFETAGTSPTVDGIIKTVEILGFCGAVFVGAYKGKKTLIQFIKEKRDRKILSTQQENDESITAILDDGEAIPDLSKEVVELYEDLSVRLAVENMTQILNMDGIVSMDFWCEQPTEKQTIIKKEVPYFKAPDKGILLDRIDERILIISVASLEAEPAGWRFKNSADDVGDFPADVFDPSFLDQIRNRSIRLASGDMIHVKLQTQQSRPRRNLKTTYSILQVYKYIPYGEDDEPQEQEQQQEAEQHYSPL